MLRVNQAGEYGAVRIYQAQLDVLGDTLQADTLREMLGHEQCREHSKPSACKCAITCRTVAAETL